MLIFGGSNTRQISQVTDCKLRSIGKLPFDFNWGTCASYHEYEGDLVMLCFPDTNNFRYYRYIEYISYMLLKFLLSGINITKQNSQFILRH